MVMSAADSFQNRTQEVHELWQTDFIYFASSVIEHTRSAPYHPMTQGKIERYRRSMKNVVKLENYYYPLELAKAITDWVQHYNHECYHESLDND